MKKRLALAVTAVLTFVLFQALPAFAQTSEEFKALRGEVKALKEGQNAIQKDLVEIKKLLQARPAQPAEFKEAIIDVEGAPSKGDKAAKLVLLEFSDYV